MKKVWCLLFFLSDVNFIISQTAVRNVRLEDPTSYVTSIIQRTVSKVEQRCWCSLKIDDMRFHVNQNVLGRVIVADVDVTDGFVVSLQKIGIERIQQHWLSRTATDASVEIRATVRIHDISVGFDVKMQMDNNITHSTSVMVYPTLIFEYTISKDLFTDEITVKVVSNLERTVNLMQFIPESDITKVFALLFPWNSTEILTSIDRWANDIFQPITLELATKEIEFPRICYDCPT